MRRMTITVVSAVLLVCGAASAKPPPRSPDRPRGLDRAIATLTQHLTSLRGAIDRNGGPEEQRIFNRAIDSLRALDAKAIARATALSKGSIVTGVRANNARAPLRARQLGVTIVKTGDVLTDSFDLYEVRGNPKKVSQFVKWADHEFEHPRY